MKTVKGARALNLRMALLLLSVAMLQGCGGSAATVPAADLPANLNRPVWHLPGLPLGSVDAPRAVAEAQDTTIAALDDFDRSDGASENGANLILGAAGGELEWAVYQLPTGGNPPLSIDPSIVIDSGEAWLALSDYAGMKWEFYGPYQTDPAALTLAARHVSPGENIYLAIIVFGPAQATIDSVTGTLDVPPVSHDPFFVTGQVLDTENAPVEGVRIYLPFLNISAFTDTDGRYVLEGLSLNDDLRIVPNLSGFSFEPNIVFLDFQDNVEDLDFVATAQTLPARVTYNDHMRPQVFEPICMNCHNSAYTGLERHGAPTFVNWDTYGGTTEFYKNRGVIRAVDQMTMPAPAFGSLKLNAFQKQLFQQWQADGFPES